MHTYDAYIYIYIEREIDIHIYIYIHTYIYIYIYIYSRVTTPSPFASMAPNWAGYQVCICVYIYIYVCVHIYIYICMCTYIYIYIYIHIYIERERDRYTCPVCVKKNTPPEKKICRKHKQLSKHQIGGRMEALASGLRGQGSHKRIVFVRRHRYDGGFGKSKQGNYSGRRG